MSRILLDTCWRPPVAQEPLATEPPVRVESRSVHTEDGVSLAVRAYRPGEGTPRGAVVVVHAMLTSGLYFDRPRGGGFASTLAAAGLETFVVDLRGHGGSLPPAACSHRWNFDSYVRYDLPAVLAAVERWTGAGPGATGYVGHSLGGLCGLALGASQPERCPGRMILAQSALWDIRPFRRDAFRRWLIYESYRLVATVVGHAPARRLGLGSDDEPVDFVRQLTGWARQGCFDSADGRIDYAAGIAQVPARVLVVSAAGDRYATAADVTRLVEPMPAERRSHLHVGRKTGFDFDPDHFGLFVDRRARPVWETMAAFLLGDRSGRD